LDKYLNPDKKWYESQTLLFEYCDKNKKTPPQKLIYKNQHIGGWFSHQKQKINSETDYIYIKLATNQYVKNSLDQYLNPDKKWNGIIQKYYYLSIVI
jgi:hypothetical protein